MNLIEAEVTNGAPARPGGLEIAAPDGLQRGQKVIAGVRPEALQVTRRGSGRPVPGPRRLPRGARRRDDLRASTAAGRARARPDAADRALRGGARSGLRHTAPPRRCTTRRRKRWWPDGNRGGATASRSPSATSRRSTDSSSTSPRARSSCCSGPSGRGQDDDAAGDRRAREARRRLGAPRRDRRDRRDTPAERDLAMVFQSYALYPKQTAAENIASPLRARERPRARSTRRSSGSPSCCTSSSCWSASPAQMSGGEMQRVALGRALVRDPRAFLMDEPLTNLDLKLRVEMRTELTRIHRSLGGTFLYVTNDQVEAMSMADQVAVLREGTVQQVGHADGDLRPPGQPLGGDVRRQPADEPARVQGARATSWSARAGPCRDRAGPRRGRSAAAPRRARRGPLGRDARGAPRWPASSTPSSRSATARWSTSRSAPRCSR